MAAVNQASYENEEEMGLFYYKRLNGSLPRRKAESNKEAPPLAIECTCSVLGKLVLNCHTTNIIQSFENSTDDEAGVISHSFERRERGQEIPVEQCFQEKEPIIILVAGFSDGSVRLMDAGTAASIAVEHDSSDDHCLFLTAERNRNPIVAVSVDASGTVLAAIDMQGNCGIWMLKYSFQSSTQQQHKQSSWREEYASVGGGFSKLLWGDSVGQQEVSHRPVVAMVGSIDRSKASAARSKNEKLSAPMPVITEINFQSWQYAFKEFGVPTCLCLDPAFIQTQRVLVAFDSGKVVLTSRITSWLFRATHDLLLHPAPLAENDRRGIEAMEWRGRLVAFCDCSGVRLCDTTTLRPIAHVERPTGANPSLYPEYVPVVPSLCFETSHSLFVSWGDCLMGLKIIEQRPELGVMKGCQYVICSMAWRLDCVAAGVVPLDGNHIGVLGLIPDDDDNGGDYIKAPDSEKESKTSSNIEMQIIDRNNGNVMYADVLALTEPARKSTGVSTYGGPRILSLLSSFALPRMEDAAEIKEEGGGKAGLLATIFSGTAGSPKAGNLVDPHLRWNLEMIKDDKGPNKKHSSPPPLIVVSCSSDVILARVRGREDRTSTKQQDLREQQKIAKRSKHCHKYKARK